MTAHTHRKRLGQFYTPSEVAQSLVRWVVEDKRVRLLDPSCGDGQFLACHPRSVGIEVDRESASLAKMRAPGAIVHEADFFEWASHTSERFLVAAGNPPFIRYQHFSGETRERALASALKMGANFSSLSSSWAPFIVVAASLLKPNGRMVFLVPAEIGHATYSRPLLECLCSHFEHVRIVAFRKKLFPQLSEDVWVLYCRGFGGHTSAIYLNAFDSLRLDEQLPKFAQRIELSSWRDAGYRLRRFLLSSEHLRLYDEIISRPSVVRLSDIGHAGIGYVTGANDFFHLKPSEARLREIPAHLLRVAVRKAEQLPTASVDDSVVEEWIAKDRAVMLLDLRHEEDVPDAVVRYLSTDEGQRAKETYKCRNRNPWYVVPDVQVPDAFLSYMSGVRPSLVRNDARCVCTNSVHAVKFKPGTSLYDVQRAWNHALTELSCELEGHPLGGGMLKLEPGEAAKVRLPIRGLDLSPHESQLIADALHEAREWRHYV